MLVFPGLSCTYRVLSKSAYSIRNIPLLPSGTQNLPGAGYEWFSVQNWVAVEQYGVARCRAVATG